MTQLVVLRNPFDRSERDVHELPVGAQSTVDALVGEYIPAGLDVDVSIGGVHLAPVHWAGRILNAGEQLLVVPHIAGDNFNPLSAVLMLAVMAVAGPAAFALYGAAGGTMAAAGFAASTAGTLMSAGIGAQGGMVISKGRV